MSTQVSLMAVVRAQPKWKLSARLRQQIPVPSRHTSEQDMLASLPMTLYHHNQRKTKQ